MSKLMIAVAFCLMASAEFVSAEEHKHEKAPHGGMLLEVGEHVAHLELVHDEKGGKAVVYVLGTDAKTALLIKEAPKFNLKTKDGNTQIATKAVGEKDGAASQFEATDDAFKVHALSGRIAVTVKDKKYNVEIKAHDHDH